MPNLVGIGNSQVPTNAMLGGLAYQDSVGEIDIDKIKARTSDTAVDVFVYNTRKDSDGGAWRHRTQNTSWYNEGASATRGARKEFPAVAVVVATTDTYTIYDGDDPNLPMWMVFESDGSSGARIARSGTSAITMLNGLMCATRSGSQRAAGFASFIDDTGYQMNEQGKYLAIGGWDGLINRNVTGSFSGTDSSYALAGNGTYYDVAMTVLPNAPINSATGLPIPTIAIAHNSGISIITDSPSGVVYDLTANAESNDVAEVAFLADNRYSFATTANNERWWVDDIQTADENSNYFYQRTSFDYSSGGQGSISPLGRNNGTGRGELGEAIFRQASGMSRIRYVDTLINYTTTDFNTGWTAGDAKGIFLSSTDDTNLSGGNKVSNSFDWSGASGSQSSTPPTGWTGGNGATFAVETGHGAVGNFIRLYNENNGGAGPNSYMYQAITTVVGTKYKISLRQIHRATIQVYVRVGNSINASNFSNASTSFTSSSSNTPRYFTGTFTATATTTYITLGIISGAHNYSVGWDDVVVTETDDDRSVSNNGLHAYGTIHKNPVATGAELVAYSNFNNSRYLFQPYNSDLDFTTTMSIMFWVNGWVGSDSLLHRGPGTTRNSKTSFHLYCSYDYNYRLTFTTDGSTEKSFEFNHTANLSGWQCVCFTLSGGIVRGFRNGVEQTLNQTSFSGNIFSQATDKNGLWIGTGPVGGAADTASLALLRLSASVPTAEQIKKMYNDEKCLFHENAKCTLHGTSTVVTALAFDDTNDILHVGTSSGRSEFQGLNRINNTTTAVTTAISASNGLVAEQ